LANLLLLCLTLLELLVQRVDELLAAIVPNVRVVRTYLKDGVDPLCGRQSE
jgi:hypothetical protein